MDMRIENGKINSKIDERATVLSPQFVAYTKGYIRSIPSPNGSTFLKPIEFDQHPSSSTGQLRPLPDAPGSRIST